MRKRKFFTPSLRINDNRNFDDPQYVEWRNYVRKRDSWLCQMPLCGKKGYHCHHIQKWATCPMLRFDKSNGILLCKECHKRIKDQEEAYAALFGGIVAQNTVAYANKKKTKCRKN